MTIHPAPKPRRKRKPARKSSSITRPSHAELLARARAATRTPVKKKNATRTPVKKTNAKRAAREFRRCFHSVERVLFIKTLPCVATGSRGTTENAHVTDDGTKGAGRRSGYRCIAPLSRLAHELLHQDEALFTERTGLTMEALAVCAAETEAQWLAFVADGGIT